MGSRKSWSCCCLGCGGLWILLVTVGILAFRSLGPDPPPKYGWGATLTFLPALLPLGIGFYLLMAEYQATAPQRRQESVDRVQTALIKHDGATPEQVAQELDLDREFTRQAVNELIADGRLVGYVTSSGRIHAMDPLQVRPGECPSCGAILGDDVAGITCPECGSRVLRPVSSEEDE